VSNPEMVTGGTFGGDCETDRWPNGKKIDGRSFKKPFKNSGEHIIIGSGSSPVSSMLKL